jgi:hypothetical protein
MATKTSGATVSYSNQPKMLPSAPIYRIFRHFETLTLSAGDVIRFDEARIPHGAQIFDVRLGGGLRDSVNVCNVQIEVGSTTTLLGSLSLSVAGRIPTPVVGPTTASEAAGVPFIVSCSDDAVVRYGTMKVTVSGATSATTSASIVLVVGYVMDA